MEVCTIYQAILVLSLGLQGTFVRVLEIGILSGIPWHVTDGTKGFRTIPRIFFALSRVSRK